MRRNQIAVISPHVSSRYENKADNAKLRSLKINSLLYLNDKIAGGRGVDDCLGFKCSHL